MSSNRFTVCLWSYLDNIAIRIQCGVPIKLDHHRLYKCGKLFWRSPVLRSLIRRLHRKHVSNFDKLIQVQLTSSKRPSIFNCHAGMPWPVSKFGGSAVPDAEVSDCHACPEDVWDRKRRSVRVVCGGIIVRQSPSRNEIILTEAVLPRASCTSAFFRIIVQSNFFSMSCKS